MNKKKLTILLAVFVLLIIGMLILTKATKPETTAGAKEINVTVVHGDGSSKDFTYHTDEEYLGPVLLSEGLIAGDDGDLLTGLDQLLQLCCADGIIQCILHRLHAGAQMGHLVGRQHIQQWWCLTKGGEDVMTGADTTPIASGDCFEFTLTVGY